MAPTRHSRQSAASAKGRDDATGGIKVPLKGSPTTPRHRSPLRKTRRGISLLQKQVLINNLQLEITERARRLRAQYHLQAQGLRSRIEIRVNRIPTSLRKVKMGELVLKCLEQEQRSRSADGRPPVLPAKEAPLLSPQKLTQGASRLQAPERHYRAVHGEVRGDKENEMENPKGERKARGNQVADAGSTRPVQVLSPTSSNSRLKTRDRPASPTKSHIARPGSPLKSYGASRSAAITSVLSSMVERAKATRHGGSRKVTTSDSSSSGATAATRGRRPATAAAAKAPPPRPVTRAGQRASGTSEASEGSTGNVVRKPNAAAATKKTTIGAIRKGVAGGGAKKAAEKPAAAPKAPKSGERVLRKRG